MLFAQVNDVTTVTYTTTDSGSAVAAMTVLGLAYLAVFVIMIIAMWKMFEKADEAGWKAIIPFYNTYTLFRIAGRNGLWFLGLFVPVLNIVVAVILSIDLAKHFGKSTVFGIIGLFFFSMIGYLILGYGSAQYVGTKHE